MTRVEQFERIRRDRRLERLSIRELARKHKVHRRVVRQALASAEPPGRKETARRAPVMGPYEDIVRAWLVADKEAPRKQRHTARRVWRRLIAEHGASVAESTVRDAVRRIREEIVEPHREAMIPQVHEPGREAEVDFGEFWALIDGVMVKLWLFSLRLSASGRACHRAFATQAQEAFFAGHVDAFGRLGGVPGRIRYDNLKPAVARVLLGRHRIESERFVLLRSHFGFDSFYCHPGIEGAHEKGGVEGDIGWFRRNHLVPVPRAASLAELNEMIVRCDDEDLSRVVEGHRATIACEFAIEAPALAPVPEEGFDVARHVSARVDTKSRVWVRQCRYSVPVAFIGRRLEVAIGATEITVSSKGTVVATHERLIERAAASLVLDHYLEALTKKPGALASSVPLAQARATGTFTSTHDAYWAEARRQLGDRKGTEALIDALLLGRTLPRHAVIAGMSAALELCTVAPEMVAIEARRVIGDHLAPVVPMTSPPRCAERPAPDLSAYDGLLVAKEEGR
ncbi:MAG: IS21 family transposase [Acidimicrobiales bacterium]